MVGGRLGHLVHGVLDRQAVPGPVARPVRQQVRRARRVAGLPGVGAAVAEPEGGGGVGEHLARGVEVAVGVVQDGAVEQLAAVVLEQEVDEHLPAVGPSGRGDAGDGPLGPGLVVGRIAEQEDPLGAHEAGHDRVVGQGVQLVHEALAEAVLVADPLHLLLPRLQAEAGLAPRRREVERVEGLEPEEDRHRAGVHLRPQVDALRAGLGGEVELAPPRLRVGDVLGQHERHRPPACRAQAAHPVDLPLGRGQVLAQRPGRGELEHTRAQLAEHRSDAEQLVLGGEGARHRLAVDGAVGQRARGREAERAGADPLAHDGRPSPRCRPAWRARCGHPARPSRRPAPGRGAPGPRCRGRRRRASRASRYSGNDSQPHWMPSLSAAPGMSSTPSISPMSHSWRSGATGAKPTPQLPITTVVTPCQHDGVSRSSHEAWPS